MCAFSNRLSNTETEGNRNKSRIKNKNPNFVVLKLKDLCVGSLPATAAETFTGTCAAEEFVAALAQSLRFR
jgi:hypothetical protein